MVTLSVSSSDQDGGSHIAMVCSLKYFPFTYKSCLSHTTFPKQMSQIVSCRIVWHTIFVCMCCNLSCLPLAVVEAAEAPLQSLVLFPFWAAAYKHS